jgi:exodeoxyribonuclease V alpha subunit
VTGRTRPRSANSRAQTNRPVGSTSKSASTGSSRASVCAPWTRDAELSLLDLEFATFLVRLVPVEHADVVEMTAALVSRERQRGHPCVDLSVWAGRALVEGAENAPRFPEREAWSRALVASGIAGDGRTPTPLVVAADRCYLHRYWEAEQAIAAGILLRAHEHPAVDAASLSTSFRALFPRLISESGALDHQALAAAAVLRNRFTVISGGPGTGKTTTIARILALLIEADGACRIQLAAPTGKAAARLSESIRAQASTLPVAAPVRERLAASEARTIHRLLGYSPSSLGFRHGRQRVLPGDVLVVDEASMVDLLLMDALLAAVPDSARLLLVGDKDQLASVEAGFVFGECCEAAAHGFSDAFSRHLGALAGSELDGLLEASDTTASPLRDCGVELRVGWRFRDRPGIGRLAEAVRRSDVETALATLAAVELDDAVRVDLPRSADAIARELAAAFAAVTRASSPGEALVALRRARILCATNRGPWGVQSLNAAVERALGVHTRELSYRGRPLLVTANDYTTGLFNGDVGVLFPDSEGRMRAWFEGPKGLRGFAASRLPAHETAWAMTVHKSQGSEFDRIVLVIPDAGSQAVTRELVYTGVTRAREQVTLFASEAGLAASIKRRGERISGLPTLLGSPPA